MPAFLKQPLSNTRSKLCVIWENNLKTFEKLFSMVQSRCSIHSHFLKPFPEKIWHQALIEDFEKIVISPNFLHLTSINWLVLKIRSCFDTRCKVLCAYMSKLTR